MTTDHQDTDTTILDTDVLVVGAGPAGLMLATELRLGGAEVVVVDQRPGDLAGRLAEPVGVVEVDG
ncbi:FAD-dependent monooxygenase, partial [Micrococcus luteus]